MITTPTHTPSSASRRRLAPAQDVAKMLSLPLTSLYEHARARRIPGVVRVGRRVLFDLDKVEAWIEAGGEAGETRAAE